MLAENQNFWDNLGKIQNALLSSDEDFSQFLDVNHDYFIQQRNTLSFLPLGCVFELAERLNFHFEDLLKDNFSTKGIISRSQGNYSLLEKYSVATYAKTRHIANVIKYLEHSRGERAKINFMRKFQLTDEFIASEKSSVNILLATDIMNYLTSAYQFTNAEFIKIGQMTPFTTMNKDIQEALLTKKNIYGSVEYFFDELSARFDKNCTYRIDNMNSDYAIIEAKSNKYVVEELAVLHTQFGSESVCATRMGLISSLTWYKYKQFVPMKKIASVYKGDRSNLYLMDLTPFKDLSRSPKVSLCSQPIYH
jgi:hypothetical protein